MASPLIAGCAALTREYYIKSRNHDPSSALLKATLINGTRWLSGQDAIADHDHLPNYHQGFGCVFMPWTIPNSSIPNLKLEFIDSSVDGGFPLRICLVWIDPPGRSLQNNLNLFVEDQQTGKKWIGNEDLPNNLKIPDPDNNVETVRIDNPSSGFYLIQVQATNLLRPGQHFALAVTGDLKSQLDAY